MNCYYHPDVAALGICRWCQRGICTDCIAEAGGGLACRDRHEREVEAMHKIIRQSTDAPTIVGSMLLLMGLAIAGYGVVTYLQHGYFDVFGFVIAVPMFLSGIVMMVKGLRRRDSL